MRDSVIFYRSYHEALRDLPPEEFKESMMAILDYALDDIEPEGFTSMYTRMAFMLIKPQIDSNNKRYDNARKGGAPKGNLNAARKQKNKGKQPTVESENKGKQPNVNDNGNENDNANGVCLPLLNIDPGESTRAHAYAHTHAREGDEDRTGVSAPEYPEHSAGPDACIENENNGGPVILPPNIVGFQKSMESFRNVHAYNKAADADPKPGDNGSPDGTYTEGGIPGGIGEAADDGRPGSSAGAAGGTLSECGHAETGRGDPEGSTNTTEARALASNTPENQDPGPGRYTPPEPGSGLDRNGISSYSPDTVNAQADLVRRIEEIWNSYDFVVHKKRGLKYGSPDYGMVVMALDRIGRDRFMEVLNDLGSNAYFKNNGSWKPSLEWFCNEANFIKVEDGNYKNAWRNASRNGGPVGNDALDKAFRELVQKGGTAVGFAANI